jgi:hypothetical protein
MSKLAIVATTLLAGFGGGQPVFAEEAIPEPRCVCSLSTGADVLNAGRPIFSDVADAFANERDSRIDDRAPTPQTLSRLGRVRYPGDHDRRTLAYTVESIDVLDRE